MMMITKMTKISLFVLAGMISGGSADMCSGLDFEDCYIDGCRWTGGLNGKCVSMSSTEAATLSLISLEANLEGDYLDQKDIVVDENIDSYWNSGSGDDTSDEDELHMYKDEEDNMDEDEDNDASSDSELGLEDEPNVNVSEKKRSYLRTN